MYVAVQARAKSAGLINKYTSPRRREGAKVSLRVPAFNFAVPQRSSPPLR
jgi:hypothetical protein